jgi:transaldolase
VKNIKKIEVKNMSNNRVQNILSCGQSIWYDNIQRSMIVNGDFERMIAEDGLRGVTSNPTIFDKAISSSNDYDDIIAQGLAKGLDSEAIFWSIAIREIQEATDIFKTVYTETQALDGYVSLEVSPFLARDTQGTIAQAIEIHQKVNRLNLMVKVPATKEGLPAITELISRGININVTLVFSITRYKEVMDAYIAGLEKGIAAGIDMKSVQCVASFFVSRLDSAVDKLLEAKIAEATTEDEKARRKELMGKAAVANSRLAYQAFLSVFATERFIALQNKGANVQRPLWASTSTKNPTYRDVTYIEELIGKHTVNTVPPATLDAFRDHGEAEARIENDIENSKSVLAELAKLGIDLAQVTEALEQAGVESFNQSFEQLLNHLKEKSDQLAVK